MEPVRENERKVAVLLAEAIPGLEPGGQGRLESPVVEGGRADLLYLLGGRAVIVEVRSVSAPRVEDVKGRLSMAVLQLRRLLRAERDIPVAVVVMDRFGDKLEEQVRRFMADCAPDAGWGLLDGRGRAVLEVPGLDVHWTKEGEKEATGHSVQERRESGLFTDLNRWMLKILLLRNAPESAWPGPRALPRHPTDLAAVARVSVEKAHRFAMAFEEEGYLVRADGGLRLARVKALLEAWLQQEAGERHRTVGVRPLVPARGKGGIPLPADAGAVAVLGGSFAARERRMLHSGSPSLPLVHVAVPLERAIRDWGLELVDGRDASLRLRRPRYPRSVFRAAVPRPGKIPLVDLWQMALDAVTSDARGREQARFIVERVLSVQEKPR